MGAYSLYIGADRLGWSFRSLWAAKYHASICCSASGEAVDVIDDNTGEVMYSFSCVGPHVLIDYVAPDADAIAYPPEKCFYNVSPASVGA